MKYYLYISILKKINIKIDSNFYKEKNKYKKLNNKIVS